MSERPKRTSERPRPPGPESARRPTEEPPRSSFGNWRAWALLAVFVVANVLLAPILFPETSDRVTIPYSEFKDQVQAGNVTEITSQGDAIQGDTKTAISWPKTPTQGQRQATSTKFTTRKPSFDDPGLQPLLESKG